MNFTRRRGGILLLLAAWALPIFPQGRPVSGSPQPPKLVLAIVVDQFRYDYLTRFRVEYTGGLKRLLEEGANFTNANYRHVPTVTAPGHATFLTGATPAVSGIIGNQWWERATGATVTSVSDSATSLLGGSGKSSSPRRLLPSTIGDELKVAGKGGKVIGISFKDRGAILPSGHSADGAYWFDAASGNFVSSSYYFQSLPGWVDEFNMTRAADRFGGREWLNHKMPNSGKALYEAFDDSVYSNELLQQFVLRALAAEKLGSGTKTDVLTVSYSGNDYVGHAYGPDSEEAHDAALRVDKLIGELMRAAETQAGAGRVLTVLTADHGVAPVPEENVKRRMPGGRLASRQLGTSVEAVLQSKFGVGKWIAYSNGNAIYLNSAPAEAVGADMAEVENIAARALQSLPNVFRVYTRTQLLNGAFGADQVGLAVRNGFHFTRSPNLTVILDPYWIVSGGTGTTHGSPFDYDTHVPVLFHGARIKPGRFAAAIDPRDIAPTLANILGISTPSGSSGRALSEILK